MWMVEGRVEKIIEKYVLDTDRVVPALKVQPIGATWTHRISSKRVTLTALDRVSVVHPPPTDQPVAGTYCSVCHQFHRPEWATCVERTG
jgi:hypothetical protein